MRKMMMVIELLKEEVSLKISLRVFLVRKIVLAFVLLQPLPQYSLPKLPHSPLAETIFKNIGKRA